MTEYEIMYLFGESIDRVWMHIQFWAGVSFGYLVLGHVAAHKLNWVIIVFLTIFYIAFTMQTGQLLEYHWEHVLGYKKAIMALSESGTLVTPPAQALASSVTPTRTPMMLAIIGTFLAAVVYLPYNYWRQARDT